MQVNVLRDGRDAVGSALSEIVPSYLHTIAKHSHSVASATRQIKTDATHSTLGTARRRSQGAGGDAFTEEELRKRTGGGTDMERK